MSTIRPNYYVIDSTPRHGENRVDRTDTYTTLSVANKYLSLRGPPLPVIIQILPGQEADLKELTDLVKSVPNGDSNVDAETFVKAVIAKIEHLEIWLDHASPFYVLVNGARAHKYISQEWRYMSDVTSGTTDKTPGFPNFVHAFIWALAGGNTNLSSWGLSGQWGWTSALKNTPSTPSKGPRSSSEIVASSSRVPLSSSQRVTGLFRASTPSSPSSVGPHVHWETSAPSTLPPGRASCPPRTGSDIPMPNSNSETSSASETESKKKGKSRLRPAPSILPVRGRDTHSMASPSSQTGVKRTSAGDTGLSRNLEAVMARDAFTEPTAPRFCSPATFIPLSILKNPRFTSTNLPIISYKAPSLPGIGEVAWSGDFPASEEAFLLPAKTTLPPFVEFTARVLGWDEGMLKIVQIAWSCGGNRDSFILTLGDAGMPLAEAFLLWELLGRERRT